MKLWTFTSFFKIYTDNKFQMIQILNMSFSLCAKDYSQHNLFQMIKTWKVWHSIKHKLVTLFITASETMGNKWWQYMFVTMGNTFFFK